MVVGDGKSLKVFREGHDDDRVEYWSSGICRERSDQLTVMICIHMSQVLSVKVKSC